LLRPLLIISTLIDHSINPQEELDKFLTNADAAAAGQKALLPAEEEYEKHRLDADSHVGMQMLKQQGWQEGRGLGAEGKEGVAAPVNAHAPAGEAAGCVRVIGCWLSSSHVN
jgi:hypothetical protein